jgi:hypothetical protein
MCQPGGMADEVVQALRQLYAVPPADFVGERDRRVRDARRSGATELADALRAARKPTVAAWLLNRVAGRYPDSVGELLDLSGLFAEAYRGGDSAAVRALSERRRELVAQLAVLAQRIAAEEGRAVSATVADQLTETVSAAVADTRIADLLRAGILAQPARYSGFGPGLEALPLHPAPAPPLPRRPTHPAPAPGTETVEPPSRERRRRQAVDRAEQVYQAAAEQEQAATDRLAALDAELDHVRDQLRKAMRDRDRAARARDTSRAALERAAERLRRARGESS